MKFFIKSTRLFGLICFFALSSSATLLPAAIVTHNVQLLATQQVNLLGVDATLVGLGPATFTFDVDANNNTIPGGASTMDTLFFGSLPIEFATLGVAGAPFELYSIDPEVVTVTNNGTHLRVDTTFGFRVFAAPGVVGADFYTSTPSVFETDIIGLQDFTGSVFQSPDRPNDATDIFVGNSLPALNLPPSGSLVGFSFDRTVAAVPEPSSFLLCSIALAGLSFSRRRRVAVQTVHRT
ncbi:MAG: PEP-CTERM sorting domain-containing protein [Aureliella sp.]